MVTGDDASRVRQPHRWWRVVRRQRLLCPLGHAVPPHAEISDTGFIRCRYQLAKDKRECGRTLFLLQIRGDAAIIVEVRTDDLAAMRRLSTPGEMLDFLGIFSADNSPNG